MNEYVDVSSHQQAAGVDLAAHYAAGYRHLMIKATEGLGYVFGGMKAWADEWHSLGADARVGYYHWLYGTESGLGQAAYFWTQVRPVFRAGDWTMTDFEDVDPSRWVDDYSHKVVLAAFDQSVRSHGQPHHVYAPNWYIANLPAVRAYLAGLPVVASAYGVGSPPPNPYGLDLVAHQYTDRGVVPGFPTPVDCNRWLITNPPSGTAPAADQEDPMADLTAQQLTQIADAVWTRELQRTDPKTGQPNSGVHPAAAWLTGVSQTVEGAQAAIVAAIAAELNRLPASATGYTLDQVTGAVKQAVLHLGD